VGSSEAVYDDVRGAIDRATSGGFVRHEVEARGGDGLATLDFCVKPVADETSSCSSSSGTTSWLSSTAATSASRRASHATRGNDLGAVRGRTEPMREDAERRAEQLETVESVLDRWDSTAERTNETKRALRSGDGGGEPTASDPSVTPALVRVATSHDEYGRTAPYSSESPTGTSRASGATLPQIDAAVAGATRWPPASRQRLRPTKSRRGPADSPSSVRRGGRLSRRSRPLRPGSGRRC
jgi:hypothetical protein